MVRESGNVPFDSFPNTVLCDIPIERCTNAACGEQYVTIPNFAGLERLIVRMILRSPHRMRGYEIRFMRKVLGWGADDLAEAVATDVGTVRAWEDGSKVPHPVVDKFIRICVAKESPIEDYGADDVVGPVDDPTGDPTELMFAATMGDRPSWRQLKHAC